MSGTDNDSMPVFPHFVTFYSYKGGVGRTLALANTALLLVRYGRKVLVVDADLEAPGLRHLPPFNSVPDDKLGFVDLLEATLSKIPTEDGRTWLTPEYSYEYPLSISDFISEIPPPEELKPHKSGKLAYMPAGSETSNYPQRVEALRIGQLYDCGSGAVAFRELKSIIAAEEFDYVLIDSRTGWSDIGGMCTRDLADTVVLVCGLNQQNIDGTHDVMRAIEKGRCDETPPNILLVASPVPNAEEERKAKRVEAMTEALGREPDVQLFYHPLLALSETPFVGYFEDNDLFSRYEKLTGILLTTANDHTDFWLNRAAIDLQNSNLDACAHAFQRAAATDIGMTLSVLTHFGRMQPIEEGPPLRKRRLIHRLITQIDENHPNELLSFALFLGKLGKATENPNLLQESVAAFETASKRNKKSHVALYNQGNALIQLYRLTGKTELLTEAEEKCRRAEEIQPGSGAYNLACSLALQGRADEALDWLAKAFEYNADQKNHAPQDEDLKSLWSTERFKELTGVGSGSEQSTDQ